MMSELDIKSREDAFLGAAAQTVTFAFQPIVNIHTGRCIGFEALLRNIDRLGYKSISSLFDHAWNKGLLNRLDMILRRLAIAQFSQTQACRGSKLFFNIDHRCFDGRDYRPNETSKLLEQYSLAPENFVWSCLKQMTVL